MFDEQNTSDNFLKRWKLRRSVIFVNRRTCFSHIDIKIGRERYPNYRSCTYNILKTFTHYHRTDPADSDPENNYPISSFCAQHAMHWTDFIPIHRRPNSIAEFSFKDQKIKNTNY